VFLSDINGSKGIARRCTMMKEAVVQDLTKPMKMLKKCEIWCIQQTYKYQSCGCATKFRQRNSERGLNFGPTIGFSTMTKLQLTRCSLKQLLTHRID
jgi:hypothetical protein